MYKYKIGYGTYEESAFDEFEHEEYYDEEELEDIIAEAAIHIIGQNPHAFSSYQEIHDAVGCYLEQFKGFKRVHYDTKFTVFGWASLFFEDWANDSDPKLERLRAKINAAGYNIWNDYFHQSFTEKTMENLCPDYYSKWKYGDK